MGVFARASPFSFKAVLVVIFCVALIGCGRTSDRTEPTYVAPTATPNTVAPAATAPTYTVQKGDYGWAHIAQKNGVRMADLIAANSPMTVETPLYGGETLRLPAGASLPTPTAAPVTTATAIAATSTRPAPTSPRSSAQPQYGAAPPNGTPPPRATAPPIARPVGAPPCAENGSCYGDIGSTGKPKTVHVGGYTRKDGTHVKGHYRSH